jgi:hypothetical protein
MKRTLKSFDNRNLVLGISLLMKELGPEFFRQANEECGKMRGADRRTYAECLDRLQLIHDHIERMREDLRSKDEIACAPN